MEGFSIVMKPVLWIALCSLVAACGVDGEPITPTLAANVGVGSSGVSSNVGVGMNKGPFSVFWGL